MPVYEYRALNSSGKSLKGILDADSDMVAREKLRASGIFPVEIKEALSKPKGLPSEPGSVVRLLRGVKPAEVSVMTRQLSTLLGAGVPLIGSLESLVAQITNPTFKKIMAQVKDSVNEGNSLALSLSQHPKVFPSIYVNMVQSGEASGSLDVVMDRLADFGEHQQALRSRFKAALAYPIFMSIVAVIVLFVLVTFIVPNITSVFAEMRQTLPLPTVMLIKVSDFLLSFWWVIVLALFCAILILRRIGKRPRGRYLRDRLKLRIPVVGQLNQKIALGRFARTLGSLLQSGVSLISALQIVSRIVDNVLIQEVIERAGEEIQKGQSLAGSLSKSSWFTSMAVQMIAVGEQSGDLERMLYKIAESQEREVETQISALTSMLEPVMILVMGVVVGFIVFSIILPIIEMSQMIR
jgi:general secretion pathway protein F